jgi:hypothetical protein
MKRIDAGRVDSTLKKAGKIVQSATRVMSQGGKVYTLTVKGTDAKGQPINSVMAYEKR